MSRELVSAIELLISVVRKHFSKSGNPPRAALWSYPKLDLWPRKKGAVADEHERHRLAALPEVHQFAALIHQPTHWLVNEALQNIPPQAGARFSRMNHHYLAAIRSFTAWLRRDKRSKGDALEVLADSP